MCTGNRIAGTSLAEYAKGLWSGWSFAWLMPLWTGEIEDFSNTEAVYMWITFIRHEYDVEFSAEFKGLVVDVIHKKDGRAFQLRLIHRPCSTEHAQFKRPGRHQARIGTVRILARKSWKYPFGNTHYLFFSPFLELTTLYRKSMKLSFYISGELATCRLSWTQWKKYGTSASGDPFRIRAFTHTWRRFPSINRCVRVELR